MVAYRHRDQSPLRWPVSSHGSSDSVLSPAHQPAHPRALALAVTLSSRGVPSERPLTLQPGHPWFSITPGSALCHVPFTLWSGRPTFSTRLAGADRVGPTGAHGPATGRLSVWTRETSALDVEG